MQNQDKIQDTHQLSFPSEEKNRGIKAMERENNQKIHHRLSAHEEQSSILSFQKCEDGEKEEKIECVHEKMGGGEQPLTTIDVEMGERESELGGPRERRQSSRTDVARQVWIPDMWGQEDLLKDLIDCTTFDSYFVNRDDIMSARASLVEEGRRASSSRFRVQNSCQIVIIALSFAFVSFFFWWV